VVWTLSTDAVSISSGCRRVTTASSASGRDRLDRARHHVGRPEIGVIGTDLRVGRCRCRAIAERRACARLPGRGCFRRELEARDACSAENRAERVREQRVAVVKHVALALEKAVDVVDEVARDSLDPGAVRLADHAGDVDAARFEVDHEQHDVADDR
jgi:hypothetical protein